MALMNRWYCNLQEARAAATATTTGADAELKRHIRSASRWIERKCGAGGAIRAFIPYLDTKLFDFQYSRLLNLKDDLLSITTLLNGDGGEMSDYFLYPANETPKRWIEPSRDADQFCYDGTPQQAISIAGKFGYCDNYEENVDSVQNEDGLTDSSSDTSLEVTTLGSFSVGMTLLVGAEALFVTVVGDSDITIVRGDNGTIIAAHTKNAAIHIYSPPEDIMLCARALAARWLQRTAASWSEATGVPEAGFLVTARIPTEIGDMIRNYVRFTF